MRVRGIQSGFGFLTQPAGFDIGESVVRFRLGRSVLEGVSGRAREHAARGARRHRADHDPRHADRHRQALAQFPGAQPVLPDTSSCFRNIPVLIQLLMWYFVLNEWLPPPPRRCISSGVLPEQERYVVPGSRMGTRAAGDRCAGSRVASLALGLPAVGAPRIRTHRHRTTMWWPAIAIVIGGALRDGWPAARRRRWTCRSQ